jgi:hypothetical protein
MVLTRYHPAVKPTLLAEQWSYHLPYVESENVEMADIHGDLFRLDFALAISKSIAGAPVLEVAPYSAVDAYECHDDMAIHRSS